MKPAPALARLADQCAATDKASAPYSRRSSPDVVARSAATTQLPLSSVRKVDGWRLFRLRPAMTEAGRSAPSYAGSA